MTKKLLGSQQERLHLCVCRALTDYLRRPTALRTPGLFVNRADYATASDAADHSRAVQ